MKKHIDSLSREIGVCCGTSCSKSESICALNELVSEIVFFKERYDLMKKTLREVCNHTESSLEIIGESKTISEEDIVRISSLLAESKRKADKILLADINSELKKTKNNVANNQPSP